MYERFTDRTKKVMEFANDEATRLNHEYVGTEHIFLGLIKEGGGVAAAALQNLGADLQQIRNAIERASPMGPEFVSKGRHGHTPRAKFVIESAVQAARNLNHNYIGTEHLLIGLMQERRGLAAHVLTQFGLTLEDVRAEMLKLLHIGK
jgi:ATP-dependent Clp protease ATP-binding subunit ClpC